MFKIYQLYIAKKILFIFLNISVVFFALSVILGLLEEISFLKNSDQNFLFPYLLTLINAPTTLFEIFPFIVFFTIQFLFYNLSKNDELNLLKKNSLTNFRIIKIILLIVFILGVFNVTVFYNFSSQLKFHYLNIKNSFSNDNKYLAMVIDTGIWIKDEVDNKKYIIKSKYIKDNFLSETIINEFNSKFELLRTIQSDKIDIKNNIWIIYSPKITFKNISDSTNENIFLKTNFNEEKINNLFSNISALNIFKLIELKKDFEKLGYSSTEIETQLLKFLTIPFFYALLAALSSIIMLNLPKDTSIIIAIILGLLICVFIYYFNFISLSLGANDKIPVLISVFFPLLAIFLLTLIGIININEK